VEQRFQRCDKVPVKEIAVSEAAEKLTIRIRLCLQA
jgi:hypothetical protein